MSLTPASRIVRRADLLGAQVGDEEVLLDIDRGVYLGFEGVGSDIWRRLERPVEVSVLCSDLADIYDGDRARIEVDVMRFLARLLEQGMIVAAP